VLRWVLLMERQRRNCRNRFLSGVKQRGCINAERPMFCHGLTHAPL
jgi:hypothetical protein